MENYSEQSLVDNFNKNLVFKAYKTLRLIVFSNFLQNYLKYYNKIIEINFTIL